MTISSISTTVTGTVSLGSGGYGLDVTVTAAGRINAGSIAVYGGLGVSHASLINLGTLQGAVEFLGADTLINFGNISAAADSVNLRNGGVVVNYGRIGGAGTAAVGVALQNATLTNYGSIGMAGNSTGVAVAYAYGSADTVNNHGAIYGGQIGVVLSSASRLVNTSVISSGDIGIDEETRTSTVTNEGKISGASIGILSAGGLVVNAGTIAGSQAAIAAYANALTLVADAGAVFEGAVQDHTGHGVLELGAGSGSLDIGDFSGFATIEFTAGAQWVLQGGTTQLAGAAIDGFTLGDALVLEGFSITGSSYTAGTGLVLDGAGGDATLHVAGIGTAGLGVSESGDGTTIETRAAAGYYFENSGALAERYLSVAGTAVNTGVMQGRSAGVTLAAGVSLVNRGSIFAYGTVVTQGARVSQTYGGTGLLSTGAGYIRNQGGIRGLETGISLADGGTIVNYGTISAPGAATHYYETVALSGGGYSYASYVKYGAGTAIMNATGAFTLVESAGAVLDGAVTDAAGNGTLTLVGNGGTLDMSSFTGFSSIDLAPGAGWTLQEGLGQLVGQEVSGFQASDTLVLDGFAATAANYIAGEGLVLSNPYADTTLHVAGGLSTLMFSSGDGETTLTAGTATSYGNLANGVTIGAYLPAGDTLLNSGTIVATGYSYLYEQIGVYKRYLRDGHGVVANAPASIINTGLISGVEYGIILSAGGDVTNAGTITASGYFYSYIKGVTDLTVTSIYVHDTGDAIFNAAGAFTLTADAWAVFDGNVVDEAGGGVLVLGSGASAGSLDISAFSGFETIEFAPGAAWSLEGGAAQLAAGETIDGFGQGDTLVLDGFAATSERFVAGTGLVLSNATGNVTLGMTASSLANDGILLTTQGTSTTLVDFGLARTISGSATGPVSLGTGGYNALTVTSTGTVETYNGPAVSGNGLIVNAGIISGTGIGSEGVSMASGTIINSGFIGGGAGGGISLGSGVIIDSGDISAKAIPIRADTLTLILDPGAQLGSLDGPTLVDVSSGTGTLVLGAGLSSLSLGYIPGESLGLDYAGFDELGFTSGTNQSVSAGYAQFLGPGFTLSNFARGDTVDVQGFTATGASYVAGTGIILSGIADSGQAQSFSETIALSGIPAYGVKLVTNSDGVEITAPCFCKGTRIATPRGQVAVEDLAVGDLVRTAHNGDRPVRWIGRRDYDGAFIAGNHLALPVRVRRHALGFNVPSRDLFVSPDHALCEGGVLVHAWRLVNGVSVTQAERVEQVEYFHIELETHDIIFAENAPVESFQDTGCRGRFLESVGEASVFAEQVACRPRVEDGFYLERLRARINKRAGVLAARADAGPLRGCVDEDGARLRGWAQDCAAPETPVELEILHEGVVIGRVIANRYRVDLRRAGLGSGCHAFDIPRPAPGTLLLRRAADGAALAMARKVA